MNINKKRWDRFFLKIKNLIELISFNIYQYNKIRITILILSHGGNSNNKIKIATNKIIKCFI